MSAWEPAFLQAISETDDLHVAPFRTDGTTHGTPTWIWAVVVDNDLYVRAYNGTASRWYIAAMQQHAGAIEAAGQRRDVAFEPAAPTVLEAVDAAYQAKYDGSQYLPPMLTARTRAATVRITPSRPAPSRRTDPETEGAPHG